MLGTALKWIIAICVVGLGAYWIYDWQQSQPLDEKDVTEIVTKIAGIVGDSKTELAPTDLTAIEYEAGRLAPLSTEMVNTGLLKLPTSRDEHSSRSLYVASELVLRRIYMTLPAKYFSLIDGDAWVEGGEGMDLSNFQIVRDGPEPPSIETMIYEFNSGPQRRMN